MNTMPFKDRKRQLEYMRDYMNRIREEQADKINAMNKRLKKLDQILKSKR